jgi:hypothetical protein
MQLAKQANGTEWLEDLQNRVFFFTIQQPSPLIPLPENCSVTNEKTMSES